MHKLYHFNLLSWNKSYKWGIMIQFITRTLWYLAQWWHILFPASCSSIWFTSITTPYVQHISNIKCPLKTWYKTFQQSTSAFLPLWCLLCNWYTRNCSIITIICYVTGTPGSATLPQMENRSSWWCMHSSLWYNLSSFH